jgi:diacylglycerol kinase
MDRLRRSFSWALQGIFNSVSSGANMRIHLVAAVAAIGLGLGLGLSNLEWAIINLTIFMVLATETINTAIEKTVDLVTDHHHPLARLAKDLAAGAVLLTAINAVVIAALIFGPKILCWLQDL